VFRCKRCVHRAHCLITWTQSLVCAVRNHRGIAVYEQGERGARGEMTLEEVARDLGVSNNQLIFAPTLTRALAQQVEQTLIELLAQLIASTYPNPTVEARDDQDQ